MIMLRTIARAFSRLKEHVNTKMRHAKAKRHRVSIDESTHRGAKPQGVGGQKSQAMFLETGVGDTFSESRKKRPFEPVSVSAERLDARACFGGTLTDAGACRVCGAHHVANCPRIR